MNTVTLNCDPMQTEVNLIECQFTVESVDRSAGDFIKNIGGNAKEKRVTFEGYVPPNLYEALCDTVLSVVKECS